ncbi:protocadherin-10 [Microcaecilia unicolor]|uniref:Protocadherin-10 n=1 Tax=Microcaecilia unicolor TaxID=1415580 RepID=A0A6P7X541_9AMPH|nr:protocadherin-10 [Microcaecilia unicolor]
MLVLFLLVCTRLACGVFSQLQYKVPEEQEPGTVVANIAEELGLDLTKLSERRFRPAPGSPYLQLNAENGLLLVAERMDREQICRQLASCLLHVEVLLENPLELFRVEVELLDVNDNPPSFPHADVAVEISESATPGTRFPLESASDPDVGANALRTYELTPNDYFALDVQTQGGASEGGGDEGGVARVAELVLQRPLDRERQALHRYVLTAVDGGQPPRTGTALLSVRVLDSNDNAPAFAQPVYSVALPETAPPGTLVLQLNATDPDEGPSGEVAYSFGSHLAPRVRELFRLEPRTGRLEVAGRLDFEESAVHQVYVQAKDLGPNAVPAHCKVLVQLLDTNDNAPEITFSTVTEEVSEAAPPGTVVALFSVADRDSDENGRVECELLGAPDLPFRLKPSFKNYYTLVTDGALDREAHDTYSLTVVARDGGSPPLSATRAIQVHVADVNDNSPRFSQPAYDVYVTENNVPGAYIYAVSAADADTGSNAALTYSILECDIQGMSVFTYVSINAENGYLYALRSFDYEQLKDFAFAVEARDAGTPPQAGNATVRVLVVDQNDNAPAIVSPPQGRNGTIVRQPLPRAAEPGYLVTRVAAVDADSGDNARLTYRLAHGNEGGLFRLDWRSGELRTARRVPEKRGDMRQQQQRQRSYELLVEVRDNGQPPLSSSATLQVQVVEGTVGERQGAGGGSGGVGGTGVGGSAAEQRPSRAGDAALDLTLILIIALGSVSFVFLLAMIVLAVRCQKEKKLNIYSCLAGDCCLCCPCGSCCPRQARARKKKLSKSDIMLVQSGGGSSGPCPPGAPLPGEEPSCGSGPASNSHHHNQNYCYQVCLTPESAKTDLMFLKPCSPARSTDAEHSPCGAVVTGYADQQPDIISNGSILSGENKHQRAELSYLVDRPRRVNSSAFQEADIVSSKDSGHGDSEQGDSDHDATNRGQSSGTDLFSNCTEECKALGHSDRCWMPSFVPSDGRQAADYRSNLHVPGMDSVPDTEVFEAPEVQPGVERSFSTFGKEKGLHGCGGNGNTLERKELDGLLSGTRAPYKPPYLTRKRIC